MNQLDRLETLAQQLIEGTFNRLFQTHLHPVELARHLAVAIEKGRRAGLRGEPNLLPNCYQIRLNPTDYATLVAGSSNRAEVAKLHHYLTRLMQEANYQLTGPLQVLLDKSEAVLPGRVEIKSEYSPVSPAPSTPVDRASRTETKETLAVASVQTAKRWLLQLGEHRLRLGEPVVRIGRALDNDIVLSDPTVSRYHAQLRWREGRYHFYPPTLMNGLASQQVVKPKKTDRLTPHTTINHRFAVQQPLTPGDEMTLGNTTLTVIVETLKA